MQYTKKLATTLLAVALVVAGGTAATADDGSTTGDETATSDLDAYLATLDEEARDEFVATQVPATTELEIDDQVPADDAAGSSLLASKLAGLEVTPTATGCWSQRWTWSNKAAAGNTLYTYYHVGYWCASGSTVTSAKISDYGGETSTPGWSYAGVVASGRGVVSNEGRSYSKHKFQLSIGSWVVQTNTPCARVRGKYTGSSVADGVCGVS